MKNKCSKISLLLFGLLCSFTLQLLNINNSSSYAASYQSGYELPENIDNAYKQSLHQSNDSLNSNNYDVNYIISSPSGGENDINQYTVVAFTCEYNTYDSNYNVVQNSVSDCGVYLTEQDGIEKVSIRAGYWIYYTVTDYISNSPRSWISDYDSSYKLEVYSYNKLYNSPNGITFFRVDKLKENGLNINIDDSETGIFNSIINAITSFFKPLFDSINDFLSAMSTSIDDGFDAMTSFFDNFFSDLSSNVNSWFILDKDVLVTQFDNFKASFNSKFSFISAVLAFPVSLYTIMFNNLSYQPPCNTFKVIGNIAVDWHINLCSAPTPLLLIARGVLMIALVFIIFKLLENIVYTIIDSKDKIGDNS